jgi:ubiquinone/menaquinone biosynthesis C-methylase UbiE
MATPWDRAAAGYVEEWVPRFLPYHNDLVYELALSAGKRVLVPSCGPGAEVVAVARVVGVQGRVRATDPSAEMLAYCAERVKLAGFDGPVTCERADAFDVSGGPWDAIMCAFGLWAIEKRIDALRAWAGALSPNGKVGVITFGPPEPDNPWDRIGEALAELEPAMHRPSPRVLAERSAMSEMFEQAGLAMVRHTIVRHTMSFKSAESFVRALGESCAWRGIRDELGEARFGKVAARFYEKMGLGPDDPLNFQPIATAAIAALPGAEVELAHRPSVSVPKPE